MTDVVPVQQQAPAVHPYEDEPYRRALRRLELDAAVISKMPGLKKSIKGDDPDEARANVMAIGLTLLSFGVRPNIVNVNAFHIIEGQAVPSTQFYCGLAAGACGHEVWLVDDQCDDEQAVACLRRSDTGRIHRVRYTVEDARKSKALDFWVERWETAQGSGKRYCAEKLLLGYSEEEAQAALATAPDWTRRQPVRSNPAWHLHRADMLAIRAIRRALKRGAPEVMAGLASFEEAAMRTMPTDRVPAIDVEDQDDDTVDGELVEEDGEVAPEPAAAELRPCHFCGTATANLHKGRLPVCSTCMDELVDAGLAAREQQAKVSMPASTGDGNGGGGEATEAGHPVDRDPAPASTDRPRPLAQQIAMQAQAAGVDHHHVIDAVTGGEKRSAKDVDHEEGELVLLAIRDLAEGKLTLVERDGAWRLDRPPAGQPAFDPSDPGRPFE